MFDPVGHAASYAEQAQVLEGRGVDLFMIETFFDVDELVIAVEAVREVSSLPIVALLTFDEEAEAGHVGAAERHAGSPSSTSRRSGRTTGRPARRADRRRRDGGCGCPSRCSPTSAWRASAGGRVVFPHATPDYFGEFAAQAVALGARIVGGCCGTTPAQIEAIRDALAAGRAPARPFVADVRELALPPRPPQEQTALARALDDGEWVVCVELDPRREAHSTASSTWRAPSRRPAASASST